MSDLTKFRPGEPIREFPSRTWNALVEGEVARRQSHRAIAPGSRDDASLSPVVARLWWDGEEALPPGSVVRLGDALLDPSDSPSAPFDGVAFAATLPEGGDDHTAITLGVIAAGGVGYGHIPGAAWARVDVQDEDHAAATPVEESHTLESASGGKYPILWKESGTGEKWAIVAFRGGGGTTSNVVAYAVVTKEAGASSHGSGGITPGAIGECELLAIDGSASGGDALEFRSRHRVPCPVGAIISLDSPHEIADGSVWPDNPDSPGEGEAAVWGSLVDVVDYIWELAGADEKKALAIPESGTGSTDIQWLGAECEEA